MSGPADTRWLQATARLALRGRPASTPNPSVGCIIVSNGMVAGRGWTQAGGRPHAEAMALEQAGAAARGADVYVSLEPCAHISRRGPSCTSLLSKARPARVFIGHTDPDPRTAGRGADALREAGIDVIEANCPVSAASLAGYLTRKIFGRPHVTLKLASSLDGRIALADGTSRWITSEPARAHVHSRRAMADAILVGGGTWRTDRPALDVRLPGLEDRSPRRVVLTSQPVEGAETISTLADIATLEAQYLYVEGGGQAAAAFLAEDLVDRLELYTAPIVIGADGAPMLGDLGLTDLVPAHGRWTLSEQRQLGSDSFVAYDRIRT